MKKIDKSSKVGFLIHTFGPIDPQVYFNHMGSMMSWAKRFDVFFCGIDKHRTAQARNVLVESALAAGCTHIMIIDADHIVSDHMPEVLCLNDDAEIVSGLVCRRRPPHNQVGFGLVDGEYRDINLPLDGRSYFVDVPAMGCTMFMADVFRKVEKPWFVDVAGVTKDGGVFNKRSDLNFFEKAQEKGIRMCIDTRVAIGHVGDPRIHYPSNEPSAAEMNRESGIRMDADSRKLQAKVYVLAKELVKEEKMKKVLDLGCGNPIKLKDFEAEIVGIDFPEKIPAISRKNVEGKWLGKDLCYPFDLKEKFDLIIAADVIEHLTSVDTFFDNVKKHLAPGGALLLSSPERSSTSGRNILHAQEYTQQELAGVVGAHGFGIFDAASFDEEFGDEKWITNVFLCKELENG